MRPELVRVPRAFGSGGEAMEAAAAMPLGFDEAATISCVDLDQQTEALAAALPENPVVLGGCCCTHVGAGRGLARRHGRIAVVWVDAHGDLNTPETSLSGNVHGMPLAHLLGYGDKRLAGIAKPGPAVRAENVAVVGARDLDPAERENARSWGVRVFTMRDIDERGMRAVMAEAIERATTGTAGVHVSFDLDGVDPDLAPGVGTPSPGGLSYREAHLAMEMLADTGKVLSAELVEVNPILDRQNGTARLGVGLLASLLGKKIL